MLSIALFALFFNAFDIILMQDNLIDYLFCNCSCNSKEKDTLKRSLLLDSLLFGGPLQRKVSTTLIALLIACCWNVKALIIFWWLMWQLNSLVCRFQLNRQFYLSTPKHCRKLWPCVFHTNFYAKIKHTSWICYICHGLKQISKIIF